MLKSNGVPAVRGLWVNVLHSYLTIRVRILTNVNTHRSLIMIINFEIGNQKRGVRKMQRMIKFQDSGVDSLKSIQKLSILKTR